MHDTWKFNPPPNKPNPFAVLGLETDANNDEIVWRGKELTEAAETREQTLLCRWAMEQLITHPLTRLGYELLEIPGARYDDPDWDRFVRDYQRPPVDLEGALASCPPPSPRDFDYERLIDMLLDCLGEIPVTTMLSALEEPPVEIDCGPPPLEIKDVLFG